MTPSYQRIRNQHFLYDRAILSEVSPFLFDPEEWRRSGGIIGEARGRGSAFFITDGVHEFVLRHYRRGGFIAKFITDHYLWLGLSQTRAWKEWHLLDWMFQHDLPVPRPAAVRVIREGWSYSADLLTITLPRCHSLADHLEKKSITDEMLLKIGECICRFHALGIYHADLNAFNILINEKGLIYLIDFDRGCRRPVKDGWQTANLSRLHRSLFKLEKEAGLSAFSEKKWQTLLKGYHSAQGTIKAHKPA